MDGDGEAVDLLNDEELEFADYLEEVLLQEDEDNGDGEEEINQGLNDQHEGVDDDGFLEPVLDNGENMNNGFLGPVLDNQDEFVDIEGLDEEENINAYENGFLEPVLDNGENMNNGFVGPVFDNQDEFVDIEGLDEEEGEENINAHENGFLEPVLENQHEEIGDILGVEGEEGNEGAINGILHQEQNEGLMEGEEEDDAINHQDEDGVEIINDGEPAVQVIVTRGLDMSFPGSLNHRSCLNFEGFAKELNRVYSLMTLEPAAENPLIEDPIPGYDVFYADSNAQILDPETLAWNLFRDRLKRVHAIRL